MDCRLNQELPRTVGRGYRQRKGGDAYPTAASYATEDPLDLVPTHLVEVVWHGNLARHKAEPAHLSARWSAKGRDFYYGFPCLRYNKRLTLRGLFQESRELGFGLVNIHGFRVLDE